LSAKHPGGLGLRPPGDGSLTWSADYLDEGDLIMLLSWLRSPKASSKRPAPYRPALESLDSRILLNGSPHFVSATATVNSAGALVVDFKEAGLAFGTTETVTVDATGTAVYACINGGGNHPKATNKETVSSEVSATGTFPVQKNGNLVGEIVVSPPSPGAFSCPPGQTMVLASVAYTGISVTDVTSGAFTAVPDTSRTFFEI
jgi:hypothetical protein